MAGQSRMPPKASRNKVGEYSLNHTFKQGYHAREDPTLISPDILVAPSQNVLCSPSQRIATVSGYVLDGSGSATIDSGILSFYDFDNFKGDRRNMRAGFLTSAGNDGKLQYRYTNAAGTVSWITLKSSLTTVKIAFCDYWDNTALIKYVLWVDGSSNVYSWNGAVSTFASATSNTVTKQGSTTWQQEGYTATGSITIGGVTATYSGGASTTTLTGVSVDFSATAVAAEIHQTPVTVALSAMTSILSTFTPSVIGCGRENQVYLGSSTSNNLYISKVNDYTVYTFTSPTRVAGEGDLIQLDAPPKKFIPLENRTDTNSYDMYISEGLNTWSVIRSTLSSDLTKETLEHIRLKVSPLQGAKSGNLVSKMKNHIIYIGNDNVANFFGYLSYQFIPELVDFSYPIINDMNSYDFTDGSIFYYKNYILVTIPKSGIIRMYNMTDQTKQSTGSVRGVEDVDVGGQPWFWEAPITYPLSGFYVVNGQLYGHSYNTSESYKLFSGGSLNGQNIIANATFAFDDKGDRTQSKASDELWVEGYISQNTLLTCTVAGDLDAFQSSQTKIIDGSDSTIVAYGSGAHSLGKNSLGTQPLGGSANLSSSLPSWFHVAKTYPNLPYYLEQLSFSSNGIDQNWELLTYGTNSKFTTEGNNSITE